MSAVHTVCPGKLLALWDVPRFAHIQEPDEWEAEMTDPAPHVEAGTLVLIPVDEDMCPVEVRVGGAAPNEPVSGPHQFVVTGEVWMGGLYEVGGVLWDNTAELDVPAGRYAVTAHRDGGPLVLVLRDLGGE